MSDSRRARRRAGEPGWRSWALAGVAVLGAVRSWGVAQPARAAPPPLSVPTSGDLSASGQPGGFSGYLSSLKRSNYLLGDMVGLRTMLSKAGVSLAIQETSEVLDNPTGGVRRGAEYEGLTQAVLQLNTQRAFGWYGGLFNVSALQIHGRNFSADNLSTLQTASGIEADRATRLWELWYDQKFLDEDRLDVKVGQQSVDQEFIVSQNALYFVNTMFGWPALPSYDLPGGGPAYPLSALGVRARYRPVDPVNLLVGVYNGSPDRHNGGDPQVENPSGVSFPTHGGALVFAELQYAYPSLGSMSYPGKAAPLGRTYKIGAWYDCERFDDQSIGQDGLSLADPASNGLPRKHRGDYSVYAVADQMLWRGNADPNHSVNAFARVMGAPQGDRNLILFSMNAGIVVHEPFRNRADDTFGVGMGYAHVSSGAQALDRNVAIHAAISQPDGVNPVRGGETYVEATYQYQLRPWWQIQPDFQYLFDPGGGVADPNAPGRRVKDEAVLGLRTNILF